MSGSPCLRRREVRGRVDAATQAALPRRDSSSNRVEGRIPLRVLSRASARFAAIVSTSTTFVPRLAEERESFSNRCLACASCNLAKGDRTKGTDPLTGREVSLFHPRRHAWNEHFLWARDQRNLLGKTPIGRATIAVLDLNGELRMQARQLWFETGWLA